MTEINQHIVYNDPLKQNMAFLFNNPQHSDTVFIIGDSKLYAWSGLLSVASPKLGEMINLHFENCHDREIKLYGVKNVESFSLVLKYIYGLDVNFSQTSLAVICELLKLSKNYELTNFSKDLANYLSKIDSFSMDSAVVLDNERKNLKKTLDKKHPAQISWESRVLHNITQIFTFKGSCQVNTFYESSENYLSEDLTCTICFELLVVRISDILCSRDFTFYLNFCSIGDKDWECTVECQLKLMSRNTYLHNNMVLPEDNSYATLTLSRDNPCVEIGKIKWEGDGRDWMPTYKPDKTYTFIVDFKSINCKTKKLIKKRKRLS